MKNKIFFVIFSIFLTSCGSIQIFQYLETENDYCSLFPNDNSKCNCLEYEKRKQVNYSNLEKICIDIILNKENETIVDFVITIEESTTDDGIINRENLRDINFSLRDKNSLNNSLCFEFGGEYKSIQIGNQIIRHSSNLTNLYYYVETNNCTNATLK